MRRYFPSLDGLRAVSIALVLIGHTFAHQGRSIWTDAALAASGLGVLIFFVISGFLITSLILREEAETGSISLSRFYLRRFLRLAPVQFLYLASVYALTMLTNLRVSSCEYLTALTYTKNYGCPGEVFGHLWSLSVEEQFYLLWPPLLALVPRPARRWIVLSLIVIGPISRALEYFLHNSHTFWLTSNIDVLMIGCAAAIWVHEFPQHWFKGAKAAWLRVATLGFFVLPEILRAQLLLGWYTVMLGSATQAVATAYLICSLIVPSKSLLFNFLNARPVAFLGKASYSLYIWQQLFMFPPALYGVTSILLAFPCNIACAVGVGLLSFEFIERPLERARAALRQAPHQLSPEGQA